MVKCKNCGADLEDGSKFCMACGTPTEDGVQREETRAVNISLQLDGDRQADKSGGFKQKIVNAKEKTLAFESKHNVILNAVMLVCAVVVLCVSLFAPIKVVGYVEFFGNDTNIIIEEDGGKNSVYSTVEIEQSIWQLIGSVWYVKASDGTKKDLQNDLMKAYAAIQIDAAAWSAANPGADEPERHNAMAEIIVDHVSDINYLGYVMATKENVGGEDAPISLSGNYWAAVVSMALGLLVTLFAIIIAIYSLVNIILAVVNMIKKKPQVKLYKYMIKMLTLSGVGLSCLWAAPMLSAGGGMFAISVFVAVSMLVFVMVGELITGKNGILVTVKRSAVALLCMIAFYILCTNIVASVVTNAQGMTVTVNGNAGYGLYGMMSAMDLIVDNIGGGKADAVGLVSAAHGIMGILAYLLAAGFAMGYAHKVYTSSIKRLAYGEGKKSGNAYMIATVIFMIIAIVLGFMSNTLEKLLIEKLFHGSTSGVKGEWLMRGQIWASMILILIAVIFNMVFDPEKIKPKTAVQSVGESGNGTVADNTAADGVPPVGETTSVSDVNGSDPFGL